MNIHEGEGYKLNTYHPEYFYVLHSSPIFILITCSILVVKIYCQIEWKTQDSVDSDQMALSEAS